MIFNSLQTSVIQYYQYMNIKNKNAIHKINVESTFQNNLLKSSEFP